MGNWDTMGERMGRIRQIYTDFFFDFAWIFEQRFKKKSVQICRIRLIRSPIRSQFTTTHSEIRNPQSEIKCI